VHLKIQYLANQPVTISEILGDVLSKPIALCTRWDAMRVGQILRRLGWVPRKYYPIPYNCCSRTIAWRRYYFPLRTRVQPGGGPEGIRWGGWILSSNPAP
jgi:hypothetical protein